jgi:hypothetical protein
MSNFEPDFSGNISKEVVDAGTNAISEAVKNDDGSILNTVIEFLVGLFGGGS